MPRYLAPEVLCCPKPADSNVFDGESHLIENGESSPVLASSAKTDVWSLGIILLEVIMVSISEFKLTAMNYSAYIFQCMES